MIKRLILAIVVLLGIGMIALGSTVASSASTRHRHPRPAPVTSAPAAPVTSAPAAPAPTPTASSATGAYSVTAWASTYDWWSNSPPGAGIEYAEDNGYPTLHDTAGGVGSYANPITFAAQNSGVFDLKPGTRIYLPAFQRYFMLEDLCATCFTTKPQVDLWVAGAAQNAGNSPDNIVDLWEQTTVEVNPPSNLPVMTTPFSAVKM